MKTRFLCAGLAAFALLHHDAWLWSDYRLVFGFLPSGLAYHAAYSLATAALWAAAARFGWPVDLDAGEPRRGDGGRPG